MAVHYRANGYVAVCIEPDGGCATMLFFEKWSDHQRSIALFEPGRGWYDGIVSGTQQRSNVISATTNAAVLESLVYLSQGPLFCQNCMPASSSSTPTDGQKP